MKKTKTPTRYEIDNFEPYNEISNGQCFYRALFSVLNHFNVDIMNLLCNNVYFYRPIHSLENGGFDYWGLNEAPGMSYRELLAKSGVRMIERNNVKNVIPCIIDSVANNRPVIIYIDCYYEPIRPDMYMQTHMPHSITIYGYDMDTEEFLIIEHDYVNGWNYKKRTLGFDDTERCYRGYVDDGRQEYDSYFEFCNDIEADHTWDYKYIFKKNYVSRIDYISKGINGFEEFILKDYFNKRQEIENEGDAFTYIYNSTHKILRNQKVRNYSISAVFEEDQIIKELINNITNDWSLTLSLINKFRLSAPERRNFSFDKCGDNLKNILNNEKEIHERILCKCGKNGQ